MAAAIVILAGVTYQLYCDVEKLKRLKKEVRYNSNFRYDYSVATYELLKDKLAEAGIRARLIYFEDGQVHVSGNQEAVEKLCDDLNLVKYSHYRTNDFLPSREGVPVKYTHSVLGGFR